MSTHSLSKRIGIAFLLYLVLMPACRAADNADCLMCHSAATLHKKSDSKTTYLYVNPKAFEASKHGEKLCIDCHTDLKGKSFPHEKDLVPVDCSRCHNTIGIKRSHAHSVHGTADPAVTCTDCHPAHTLKAAFQIKDCRSCHPQQVKDLKAGAHQKAGKDAPTCVTCHGSHGMKSASDPKASTHPLNVPAKCGKCHDNARTMKASGLPTDRLETYRDSYHGVANKHGDISVATCVSCHGSHKVLPSSNKASLTNTKNLPATCGKCHPGATENFAKGKMHIVMTKHEGGVVYYVANSFKWLTIGTMVMLMGHIGLDLFSRARRRIFGR